MGEACVSAYEDKFGSHPKKVEDKKCQSSHSLFKSDELTSLEECQDLCQNTSGCNYFSFGVDTGNNNYDQKGDCIGCAAPLKDKDGFNTWELTETQQDHTCEIGVLTQSGKYCCAESCGVCGGDGCSG